MEMMNEQSETACFDVDGVRYRYLYMKEDDPARGRRRTPVLFVHGFAQNALSWFPTSRTIFLERDVYGIDLVGHGGSSVPVHPAPYSLPAMGEALLALIKLIPGKPLVVAYSMGGRVALSALLEVGPAAFAKQTSGLLLESVGMGPKTQAERDAAIKRDADMARRLRETPLKDFMTYWENLPLFESQKALPKKVRAAVRANRLANPRRWRSAWNAPGSIACPHIARPRRRCATSACAATRPCIWPAKKTQNTASSQQACTRRAS